MLPAGAINSPMLLVNFGIGSAGLLEKPGINVSVDNPGLGENLQNRVMVTVSSEVRDGLKAMDPIVRQDPAPLAAAKQAYEKQSGPFDTSRTCTTGQLPFPGIQTDEGRADLEQSLLTRLTPH